MIKIMKEATTIATARLNENENKIIMSVLPAGISISDITKRCKWVQNINDNPPRETLLLDGNPVLTLFDAEYITTEGDGVVKLQISQKYIIHKAEQ